MQAEGAEAQAAYEAAEDALGKSSVRAPFDGIVYTLPVKQGAYVQTGDLLLQEGDLSKMLVRSFVDEPEIGRLATGQKIEVTWDAVPGRTWNGTVSTIPSTVKLRGARNVGEVTSTVDNTIFACCPTSMSASPSSPPNKMTCSLFRVKPCAWTTPSLTSIRWSMAS